MWHKKVLISASIIIILSTVYFIFSETKIFDSDVKWTVYKDNVYGYEISYPDNLHIKEKYDQPMGTEIANKIIYFLQNDDYGVINIKIFDNTTIKSLDQWLEIETQKSEYQRPVVEKNIIVDGYNAITTHVQSDYESETLNLYDKTTVFIRDNTLFEINARFVDDTSYDKVLSSFKSF